MRQFAIVPPFTDISKIKSDARHLSEKEGLPYTKALDNVARQATGLPWSILHPSRTGSILDTGTLVMEYHGVTLEFEHIDKILPTKRESVPVSFSICLIPPYAAEADTQELGRPIIAIYLTTDRTLGMPRVDLSFSETQAARLISCDEPKRVRCGILLSAVRISLETLLAEAPVTPFTADPDKVRQQADLHREAAHMMSNEIDLVVDQWPEMVLGEILSLIGAIAPATALAWPMVCQRLGSEEEGTALLRKAVAFAENVYGPFPIRRFVGDIGTPDWQAVYNYLRMRDFLAHMLEKAGQDDESIRLRAGLERETKRIDKLIDYDPDYENAA